MVSLSAPQRHVLESYLGVRIERVGALLALHILAARCRAANAEYRCIDQMDRWAVAIVLGLIAVAGLYIGGADLLLRALRSHGVEGGYAAAGPWLWCGLFVACGGYLLGAIAWLRHRTLAKPVPHPGWFGAGRTGR